MAAIEGDAAGQAAASGNLRRHARTQLRQAAADILKQEVGGAWALVWQSRIDYPRDVWPYLKVYADREENLRLTASAPAVLERSASLNVVAMLNIPPGSAEKIEDRMDDIALTIETLLTDEAMQAKVAGIKSIDLQSSAMDIVLNADEKIDHAELSLGFIVKYHAIAGVPESLI
jgi:hypothetical protein